MSGFSCKHVWLAAAVLAAAIGGTGAGWAQGFYHELPPGPYRAECRHERVEGGYLLRATCPKRNGEMREASLDLRSCPRGSTVINDGAYLKCTGGGSFGGG
ncbi:MAG TPA: hypothetical protein VJ890_18950, partial [Vineibacter sp.]|nr:hypothetical protein [Vineibacter sp.]